MSKAILHIGVGAFALISAAASGAWAQQTDEDADRLDLIIVTAQKRSANIQEVPISISAYSADFIEDSGVETLQDIALYSPNLTIATSSQKTNQRISIRGVGSVGNTGIEPSVGVFIDGVYYPRSGSVVGNLIDLEAIEVLRGPQGTLFGRNTPLGALNIRTKDASRNAFEHSVELGAGSHDSYTAGGSVSGPINDLVAFRLSGKYSERGGYGENLLTGEEFGEQDELNVRGKLDFEFSSKFGLKLIADYNKINSGGQTIELLNSTASSAFLARIDALFGPGTSNVVTSDPYDHDINQDHRDILTDQQWGLSAEAEYELGSGHSIKSITAYRNWEASTVESTLRLPIDFFPRKSDYTSETFSQEFQFLSPTGQTFEYVAGLFYYDESFTIDQDFDLGAQFCFPAVRNLTGSQALADGCAAGQQIDAVDGEFEQSLKSIAVFGQGTWNVNDQWSLTVGGRYTSDDKKGDFSSIVYNPTVTALRIRQTDVQADLDAADYGDTDAFTYMANVRYFPSADVMLFATASTGFKSGGFNAEGSFPALTRAQRGFAPEETTNYEVGMKSQLLGKTLQLNVTAFLTDIEDFQDRSFDGISLLVRNAGELRQSGVETDFIWAPLEQLTFTGGLAYLESEFLDYRGASPLPGGAPQDLTGERNHFAPEWQGSLVVDWDDDFAAIEGVEYFLRGESQYIGEQNVGSSTNQDPQTIQDAYSLFNARIGLRSSDERWEVNLFGRNLTDEGYCVNFFEQPFGSQIGATNAATNTTAQRCAVGDPLTWGVQLRLRK
jgi:iron complex outermembrane receptor protein